MRTAFFGPYTIYQPSANYGWFFHSLKKVKADLTDGLYDYMRI